MNYPSTEEVNTADRIQICRWWRFLKSPEDISNTEIMNLIAKRYKELGGFTPAISKALGWG